MRFASREKAVLSQWEVGAGLVPGGGPTGAGGPTGPQGAPATPGLAEYTYIYNQGAQTVQVGKIGVGRFADLTDDLVF